VLPLSRRVSLVPWTLAHDGRALFGSIYASGWSGVARVDTRSGALKHIRRFEHPASDQADGSFDGRWLVWNEYRSLDNFNDFTTWAWESRSGRVQQIGGATRNPDGSFWESPWRQPDARKGIATWAQGSGPAGVAEVHVYNLAQSRDLVARTGHPQGPFLVDGPLVVWPESPAPNVATAMRAFNPATGGAATPPRALRPLRGVSGLSSNGSAIAYPDGRYKSLWVAPSLRAAPHLVLTARGSNHIDNSVQVGGRGRYVGFGIQPRTFLADAKVGRYLQISRGGWTRIDKLSLVLVRATESKSRNARAQVVFVPLRKLPPIPACR
jgi:hypothetical protein